VARRRLSHEGTLVLDSEGLSKLLADDETVVALVAEARSRGMEVVICALTIIEAVHAASPARTPDPCDSRSRPGNRPAPAPAVPARRPR
jgi:hypothetical protein